MYGRGLRPRNRSARAKALAYGEQVCTAAASPAAPNSLRAGGNEGLCSLGTRQSEAATAVQFAEGLVANSGAEPMAEQALPSRGMSPAQQPGPKTALSRARGPAGLSSLWCQDLDRHPAVAQWGTGDIFHYFFRTPHSCLLSFLEEIW